MSVERFAVAAARFNETVVRRLVEGAEGYFAREGIEQDLIWVPGAFELPLISKALAGSGRYRAVVCLGAVIRGETPHFDLVAEQAASGIMQAGMETGVPVVFGVLTTDTLDQAMERSGGTHGNKGWDAAAAAVAMAASLDRIDGADPR